ncbi:MAG: biotin/lipoyl-binding protein [Treponema sp.]|nr:biotin/lipoyl-binding protein [Treponema sp.]
MHYRIHINGKPFDVVVEVLGDAVGASAPLPTAATVAPMPTVAPTPPAPACAEERVTSPFPGSVMQISVTVGQTVIAGQCLIILEAMKMHNEIVAPRASVVKQILVSRGAIVNTDDVLLVLE